MYGDEAPSGRLPYTVAKNEADYGHLLHRATADKASNYYASANLIRGVYIDYCHFTNHSITPRFGINFGLTCAIFEYANLDIVVADIGTSAFALPRSHP